MNKSRLRLLQSRSIELLDKNDISLFEYKSLLKGSMLYSQDINLIILKSGSAKLCFFEDGEEFIIYHMQKDNITILDDTCAIEILEDSDIYVIKFDDIDKIVNNKEFIKAHTDSLVHIILLQRQIIKSILFDSAKGRIANFLIELALEQNLKQNGYRYIFLPFSLKVLSSFVGLKRQSASTAFNELLKDDIIRRLTPHEFLIIDYKKLQSYTTYNPLE